MLTAIVKEALDDPIPTKPGDGRLGVRVELGGAHLAEFTSALRSHEDASFVSRYPGGRGSRAMRQAYERTTVYRALADAGFSSIDSSRTTLSAKRRYVLTVLREGP
jgi:hypothetical protein